MVDVEIYEVMSQPAGARTGGGCQQPFVHLTHLPELQHPYSGERSDKQEACKRDSLERGRLISSALFRAKPFEFCLFIFFFLLSTVNRCKGLSTANQWYACDK